MNIRLNIDNHTIYASSEMELNAKLSQSLERKIMAKVTKVMSILTVLLKMNIMVKFDNHTTYTSSDMELNAKLIQSLES